LTKTKSDIENIAVSVASNLGFETELSILIHEVAIILLKNEIQNKDLNTNNKKKKQPAIKNQVEEELLDFIPKNIKTDLEGIV